MGWYKFLPCRVAFCVCELGGLEVPSRGVGRGVGVDVCVTFYYVVSHHIMEEEAQSYTILPLGELIVHFKCFICCMLTILN